MSGTRYGAFTKELHYNPIEDFDDSIVNGRFSSGGEELNNYYDDQGFSMLYEYINGKSNDIYDMAIAFGMNVALRIGEIRALKYSDFDPTKKAIKIVRATRRQQAISINSNGKVELGKVEHITDSRLKCNKEMAKRYIPLTEEAIDIIERAHSMNPNGEYLFMYRGRQLSCDTYNNHIKSACLAVDTPYHSCHKFRFYNARRLYKAVGLTKTSRILGHSSTAQTLHYIKMEDLSEEDFELCANALKPISLKEAV